MNLKNPKTLAYAASLGLGAMFGGVCVGVLEGRTGHLPPAVPTAIVVTGVLLLACVTAIPMWRRTDEVAREAQQSAWYWGGSIGSCFAGGLAVYAALAPEAPILTRLGAISVNGAFASGLIACMMIQLLAFAAGWAIWWASKR
jgi:hypothetical protein